MKKLLLLSAVAFSAFGFAQQQVILNQNFDLFTNGNIATDVTGATAGQGDWYIYGGTGTTAADFQIVNIDVPHGKSAQITSGAGYVATNNPNSRFLFYSTTTPVATASNDILKGQMQFYTGPATGAGRIMATMYTAAGLPIIGISYDYATKKITGQGRLTKISDSSSGYFGFNLGTHTFPANSWVTVSFLYRKSDGVINYSYTDGTTANSFSGGFNTPPAGYTLETGHLAAEIDIINSTNTGNTVANVAAVDNVNLVYTNASLLGVDDVKGATIDKEMIAVYPNPTTEFLSIKSDVKVKSVSVFDMSGKKVDVKLEGNTVDVKHLESGAYMINIETKNDIQSLKFIKK